MRSLSRVILLAIATGAIAVAGADSAFRYHVSEERAGAWPAVLGAAGLLPGDEANAGIVVIPAGDAADPEVWRAKVESGTILVLEGASPLAASFGFVAGDKKVAVRNVKSATRPELPVIWEEQLELPVFTLPEGAVVFAAERWSGAPLVAGVQHGEGAVLWMAAGPGKEGHKRFPYLLQALRKLGMEPPFRSRELWAFFDWSYRSRVDLGYFAARWRRAGISGLHVAAWHFFEPDPVRDAYLNQLIAECHRNAIHVYAWLELPHVSDRFWTDHPEWREKTAVLQDAHLDWRKLMNLANPDCARAVAAGLHSLLDRFDWDGVNLAELYFESLEGAENPARFTPLNDDVRTEFQAESGMDPLDLFQAEGDHGANLEAFLDYRARLAQKLQRHWIAEIESARSRKPHLDLVLTHVDDQADPRMRELIGADTSLTLPLLEQHDFTFLIEDPATVWDQGPSRYERIAAAYEPLTPRQERLAIDINIVERYQDVYPTKQQTGIELLRQLHLAAQEFSRVAVYAEHSLLKPDLELLPSGLAAVERFEMAGGSAAISSPRGVGIPWSGGALVDGEEWPLLDDETLWVPPGAHSVETWGAPPALRVLDFNGVIESASAAGGCAEIGYRSASRAFARLDAPPALIEIDGFADSPPSLAAGSGPVVMLPRGQHLVRFCRESLTD